MHKNSLYGQDGAGGISMSQMSVMLCFQYAGVSLLGSLKCSTIEVLP